MSLQRPAGVSQVDAGLSRRSMSLDGCLISKVLGTAIPTVSTVEEVLATITLPTKLITNNNEMLSFLVWASCAANGNNKTLGVRLASLTGTLLASTGAVAGNGSLAIIDLRVGRTGAASIQYFHRSAIDTTGATGFGTKGSTSPATDLTTFVITGTTPSAAADLSLRGYRVMLGLGGGVQTAGGILA